MVSVCMPFLMALTMKGSGKLIKCTEEDEWNGRMEAGTMGTGILESRMGLEWKSTLTKWSDIKGIGKMDNPSNNKKRTAPRNHENVVLDFLQYACDICVKVVPQERF